MATIERNIALIRNRLGSPDQDAPTDPFIFEMLEAQIQHHVNQLGNTRGGWGVSHFPLTATPGTEDYVVTASNFGRPFWVHTEDTADPAHQRRDVDFSYLADLDQRYRGPQETSSQDPHTARAISFYRSNNKWYARIAPKPGAAGVYRVWYETALFVPSTLQDTPGLTPFHHLIVVQTSLALLPYCKWGEITFGTKAGLELWLPRVQAITPTLLTDELKFQKQFDLYRANASREQITDRAGYGEEYESTYGDGFGIGVLD